jgi:hypothetical protein
VPEVNRSEEIDALIAAVTQMLTDIAYPMTGKRIVWVMDDRVYRSGTECRLVDKHAWETSPFANVHKFSHDIYPAKAALGAGGCTDCHRPDSEFFFAPVLTHLFDEQGQRVVEPQYLRLGLNGNMVTLTSCCQVYVKPGLYSLMLLLPCALIALVGGSATRWVLGRRPVPVTARFIPLLLAVAAVVGVIMLMGQPELMEYMLPTRMWLDANHFLVVVSVALAGVVALLWQLKQRLSDDGQTRTWLGTVTLWVLLLSLLVAGVSGLLVFLKVSAWDTATRAAYTLLDVAITVLLAGTLVTIAHGASRQLRDTVTSSSGGSSERR